MATVSPPSSTDKPGVETHYRKPQADLYTLMLAIALVAILVAILFLYFENQVYEWKTEGQHPHQHDRRRARNIGPLAPGILRLNHSPICG